jgi:predicted RNA-binding protein with EMAP domain
MQLIEIILFGITVILFFVVIFICLKGIFQKSKRDYGQLLEDWRQLLVENKKLKDRVFELENPVCEVIKIDSRILQGEMIEQLQEIVKEKIKEKEWVQEIEAAKDIKWVADKLKTLKRDPTGENNDE